MTAWSDNCDATLTELVMEPGVCKRRDGVTNERAQENQRDDDVGQIVVGLELVSASVSESMLHSRRGGVSHKATEHHKQHR